MLCTTIVGCFSRGIVRGSGPNLHPHRWVFVNLGGRQRKEILERHSEIRLRQCADPVGRWRGCLTELVTKLVTLLLNS